MATNRKLDNSSAAAGAIGGCDSLMSMSLMMRETLKPDSDVESSVPGEGEEEKERYKDEVKQKVIF